VKRTIVLVLGVLLIASMAIAATTKPASAPAGKSAAAPGHAKAAAEHPMVPSAADVTWGPAPGVLPAGAQLAVLDGDPGAAGGYYTVRLKMPDGYKIMPHWHPTAERVTVLEGTFNVGMGKTFDPAAAKPVSVGGFGTMPAKMAHYAVTSGATIIQISGMGPFALTYINPADDPSKKK
jgi:hypothetical protein